MELEQVKLQTTWNDAAGSINSNYAKIADAIAQLKTNGGGGGGGADIDLTDYATKVWVEAKGYITASALTPYLKTEAAEETYATKDFVNNKLINYATIGSVTAIQNTLTGQIGAVNASVEQLAATKLDSSYFTQTNIQSTLDISDWALAASKPSYTAAEVGALGEKDTAQQSYGLRHSTTPISDAGLHWWSGQFQVSTEPVSGKVYLGSSGDYTVISVPNIDGTSSIANACVLRLGFNRQFFHEIFTSPNSNNIYHRNVYTGNGYPWRQFAFTSDIPTALSQFTDDVVAGKYLPITGGIINTAATTPLTIKNTQSNPTEVGIRFICNNDSKGWIGYDTQSGTMLYTYNGAHRLGIKDDGTAYVDSNTLIHSGNIGNYKSGDSDKLGGYGLTRFLLMTGRDYTEMDLNTIGGSQSIFTEIRTTEVTTTNSPHESYGALLSLKDRSGIAKMQFLGSYDSSVLYFRSQQGVGASITSAWKTIAFTDSNVASATKLKTRCKLWGNGFDGSANIGGDITLNAFQDGRQLSIQQSGSIKFSTPSSNGWVTSLDIYASDKTTLLTSAFGVYGTSEDVQYAFIGGTYDHPNVVVQDDTGYVGIGTINPEERLHVIGTIKSGNLSVSNQIDVKTIVGKGFGLYSSDTNPYLELNQNGKVAYLQMMGDNGMVALGSTSSKSLVVNAAGFVSVNRGYVNPTEALDVGGNILASGNINATSITINGVTITASNGTITVNGNVFAKGDITGGV